MLTSLVIPCDVSFGLLRRSVLRHHPAIRDQLDNVGRPANRGIMTRRSNAAIFKP